MERTGEAGLRDLARRLGMDPADLLGEERRAEGRGAPAPGTRPRRRRGSLFPLDLSDCPACGGTDDRCSGCDDLLKDYGLDAASRAAEEDAEEELEWRRRREREMEFEYEW